MSSFGADFEVKGKKISKKSQRAINNACLNNAGPVLELSASSPKLEDACQEFPEESIPSCNDNLVLCAPSEAGNTDSERESEINATSIRFSPTLKDVPEIVDDLL